MEHTQGWTSCLYGVEQYHHSLDAAEARMAEGHNGTGHAPDGVWCCNTGSQPHCCSCKQCQLERVANLGR